MRNGQNNNKRMRGRHNQHQHQHQHQQHRKGQNPMSRVFESNGPDVKIRGNPSHIAEKYIQLARDAQSSGDPVSAENYFQHAEHYNRLIAAAQEQFRQQNPQLSRPEPDTRDDSFEDGDDDAGTQPGHDGDSPYGTREPQPYVRESQPFQQPQQPQPRQQHQPGGHDGGDVDRLPSFITGGQQQPAPGAQPNQSPGQNGHDGQSDRFPLHRRRRRQRGPRPEFQGGAPRDDAPQQD
jgi:hypothetical protein